MSVAVRRALYGKMAGDTTLTTMLGTPAPGHAQNIYYEFAEAGAEFPYVVFNLQSSVPRYQLRTRIEDEIWAIKGVGDDDADVPDQIKARLDVLFTDVLLVIAGQTQRYGRYVTGIDYGEVRDGRLYRHAGGEFRIMYV